MIILVKVKYLHCATLLSPSWKRKILSKIKYTSPLTESLHFPKKSSAIYAKERDTWLCFLKPSHLYFWKSTEQATDSYPPNLGYLLKDFKHFSTQKLCIYPSLSTYLGKWKTTPERPQWFNILKQKDQWNYLKEQMLKIGLNFTGCFCPYLKLASP